MRARHVQPAGGVPETIKNWQSRGLRPLMRRTIGLPVAVGLVTSGLWGCSDDDEATGGGGKPDVPELRVVASEDEAGGSEGGTAYAFDHPAQVQAGVTQISLVNEGDELHHGQLFKLNDDATVEDLQTALATGDPAAALEVGTFEGGTSMVAPGDTSSAEAVVDLTEGTYVILCLVESPEAVPHMAAGMVSSFEVTAGEDPQPAPEADVEVELADYSIELPESIPGDALLEVTNTAELEPHEMIMVRLDDGAAMDDVLDAVSQEPSTDVGPATAVGGTQGLLPGASQWLQLDLDPGDYVVLCVIPSPDGSRHIAKGMIQQITVT